MAQGKLYIVATPIGNLADMSSRAKEVLGAVDLVAAEDTRHSRRLLEHFGIDAQLVALHDHNEPEQAGRLVEQMASGTNIALISDAGTPLVSDPGYRLVRACVAAGIEVTPVPGASAVMAALSAAGLATDRFCFEGFLPARAAGRRGRLAELRDEPRTLVLFEAPHRVTALLEDVLDLFGGERQVAIARELTKQFEQIWRGDIADAVKALAAGEIPQKGEFVLVLEGGIETGGDQDLHKLLEALLSELPPARAASVASRLTGANKRELYNIAMSLKKD